MNRVGYELRLYYYLVEIMLYHNFLECLAESTATGTTYGMDDINKGRACVAAATNAILYTSMRLARTPTTTLTWSSAYTIFISARTLLVAAAFTHARKRHAIHSTVHVAIQILQDTTYSSSRCKTSYLNFIQVNRLISNGKVIALITLQALSERVMMPLDFAPFYQSTSSTEQPATTRGARTDQRAS